jgi:hypothetical protein
MTVGVSTIFKAGNAAGGTVTGTAIATLSHTNQVTQAGQYELAVYASVGSGVGANDAGNISVVIGSITLPVPIAAVSAGYGPYKFIVTLDGSTDVVAQVGANTSVGAYNVMLTADYLGSIGGLRR